MKTIIKTVLLSHPLVKLFAVFCGYCFWLLLASNQITTRTFKIPLMFYNTAAKELISSHPEVEITIKGQRKALHGVEQYSPSVHLDASTPTGVEQQVELSEGNILLPNSVNLVNYSPKSITIHKDARPDKPESNSNEKQGT